MSPRKDLPDHVEHGVVVEGVADLLQLLEQPIEDPSLDGVGRDEVEDEAVLALPVSVDPPMRCSRRFGFQGMS